MIDREARDRMAEALRHLVAGQMTNTDFEDALTNTKDCACPEIDFRAAWPLYDDFRKHRLANLPRILKRDLARAILFLKSDNEYRWPRVTGLRPDGLSILGVLTMGFATRRRRRRNEEGCRDVWPFYSRAEYEEARRTPPYLCGSA